MDAGDFGKFYADYQCTAYDALEGTMTMSQGELKHKWKTRMLRVHPDKGGSPAEAQKVNAAWDILKEDDTRAAYDAFLEQFPTADAYATEKGQALTPTGADASEELSPLELLEKLGFEGVEPADVDELFAVLAKIVERATWSYFGFWFRGTVPITDTMHPIGFLVYFMSSDAAQTIMVMALIAYYEPNYKYLGVIPVVEILLTACIALYIFREQVYKRSETWNVNYVLRTRVKYWQIRAAFALAFFVAGMAAKLRTSYTPAECRQAQLDCRCSMGVCQDRSLAVLWCLGAFRFYLALSQWLTHLRAIQGGWVFQAVGGPKDYVEERRTNLLLYYDSWLNSFLICLPTGVVGSVTMTICMFLFLVDLMATAWSLCNCVKDEDTGEPLGCVCMAAGFFAHMLSTTSWAAYKFSGWRLRVMQEAWEEGDGKACERELAVWELRNFDRALSKEVRKWLRRREQREKERDEAEAKDDDEAKAKSEDEDKNKNEDQQAQEEQRDEDNAQKAQKAQKSQEAQNAQAQELGRGSEEKSLDLSKETAKGAPLPALTDMAGVAAEEDDPELGYPLSAKRPDIQESSQKCICCL